MSDELKTVIHVDPTVESGRYANAATIMHSASEFIIDFIILLPGDRRKVVSRVLTSPAHAKQLVAALAENVAKYERAYGEIDLPVKDVRFTGSMN